MSKDAGFLFVNKSAESGVLTRSSGNEKLQIYSHAQRIANDRGSRNSCATWNVVQVADFKRSSPKSERANNLTRKRHISPGTTSSNSRKDARGRTRVIPDPQEQSLAVAGDPYSEILLSVNGDDCFLRHIYSTEIIPLLFPVASLADAGQFTLALTHHNRLVYHAFSCLISTRLQRRSNNKCYRLIEARSKQAALVHLRELVSSEAKFKVDLSHCYAISMLIWVEFLSGNFEDAKAHSMGLNHLLHQACDTSGIPTYVVRIIHACSTLCASMLDAPPILAPQVAPHEKELSQRAQTCLASLSSMSYHGPGYAFFLPANLILLGPQLTKIAVEFQRVVALREALHDSGKPLEEPDTRYICLREAAVEYDLQALQFDQDLDFMQHAIRVSLLIFSSTPLIAAIGNSAALLRKLAQALRQYLQPTFTSLAPQPGSELLLWVLTVGGFVAYEDESWSWFKFQMLKSIEKLNLTSYSQFELTLQRYYYCKYLKKVAAKVWDEYEQIL